MQLSLDYYNKEMRMNTLSKRGQGKTEEYRVIKVLKNNTVLGVNYPGTRRTIIVPYGIKVEVGDMVQVKNKNNDLTYYNHYKIEEEVNPMTVKDQWKEMMNLGYDY